jgi:hypothetical protein
MQQYLYAINTGLNPKNATNPKVWKPEVDNNETPSSPKVNTKTRSSTLYLDNEQASWLLMPALNMNSDLVQEHRSSDQVTRLMSGDSGTEEEPMSCRLALVAEQSYRNSAQPPQWQR